MIVSGKLLYGVVVHLEAVKKTEEVPIMLGLEEVPDDFLVFEAMTTIIHESIHCGDIRKTPPMKIMKTG